MSVEQAANHCIYSSGLNCWFSGSKEHATSLPTAVYTATIIFHVNRHAHVIMHSRCHFWESGVFEKVLGAAIKIIKCFIVEN